MSTAEQLAAEEEFSSFVEASGIPGSVEVLTESAADGTTKRKGLLVNVTLIREGFGNERDKHHYGRDALQEALPLFDTGRVKMYINHLDAKTKRDLGGLPRPIEHHGARLLKAWMAEAADGSMVDGRPRAEIQGQALIAHPLLEHIVEADPEALGTSIDARGRAVDAMREGRSARAVAQITRVASTDFVTEAGANGKINELVESFIEAHSDDATEALDELFELGADAGPAEQGDDSMARDAELERETDERTDLEEAYGLDELTDDEIEALEAELEEADDDDEDDDEVANLEEAIADLEDELEESDDDEEADDIEAELEEAEADLVEAKRRRRGGRRKTAGGRKEGERRGRSERRGRRHDKDEMLESREGRSRGRHALAEHHEKKADAAERRGDHEKAKMHRRAARKLRGGRRKSMREAGRHHRDVTAARRSGRGRGGRTPGVLGDPAGTATAAMGDITGAGDQKDRGGHIIGALPKNGHAGMGGAGGLEDHKHQIPEEAPTAGHLHGNVRSSRRRGAIDRSAGIGRMVEEMVDAEDIDGLLELIEAEAAGLADDRLEEAVDAAMAGLRDEYDSKFAEQEEKAARDLEQVNQRTRTGALIDRTDLPDKSKESLKESMFDEFFEARVTEDGDEIAVEQVIREAVSEAVKAKKAEVTQFKEARVSNPETTATRSGSGPGRSARTARRGRLNRDLDAQLGIPAKTPTPNGQE